MPRTGGRGRVFFLLGGDGERSEIDGVPSRSVGDALVGEHDYAEGYEDNAGDGLRSHGSIDFRGFQMPQRSVVGCTLHSMIPFSIAWRVSPAMSWMLSFSITL